MVLSNTLFDIFSCLAAILYLGSAGLVASNILYKKAFENLRSFVLISASASIIVHALLILHGYSLGNMLAHDFFNMLSLVFFVISVFFLISTLNKPVEVLAVIVFPFSAIAVLLNIGNAFPAEPSTVLSSALQVHIILSVLSYSLLTIAAFQAIILSIQEKQLHDRQPGHFINALPPLQLMENLLFQTITVGVFLLTFALGSGFIFLDDIFAQHLVHKTVLSILAWLVFSTLLWGRFYIGWRGQTAIKWTYGGYLALMLAYFGSKFVLQLILGLN